MESSSPSPLYPYTGSLILDKNLPLIIIHIRSNQTTQRVRDSRQRSLHSNKIVYQHGSRNKKINKETKEQFVSILLVILTMDVYLETLKNNRLHSILLV